MCAILLTIAASTTKDWLEKDCVRGRKISLSLLQLILDKPLEEHNVAEEREIAAGFPFPLCCQLNGTYSRLVSGNMQRY